MGSWKGRGNQYIQLVKVLYCTLLSNGKQLPAFPLEIGAGIELRSQRWGARAWVDGRFGHGRFGLGRFGLRFGHGHFGQAIFKGGRFGQIYIFRRFI